MTAMLLHCFNELVNCPTVRCSLLGCPYLILGLPEVIIHHIIAFGSGPVSGIFLQDDVVGQVIGFHSSLLEIPTVTMRVHAFYWPVSIIVARALKLDRGLLGIGQIKDQQYPDSSLVLTRILTGYVLD